ncbi:glycerol-3-phosphate 1-O-acyltransferase PlsY [Parathermosynechococcus lividus]
MSTAVILGVMVLTSYLLGSIPTGYWVAKHLRGIDIRDHGSGSTGATNVLRVVGKGAGLFTFVVDVLKGTVAVVAARWSLAQPWSTVPPAWGDYCLLAIALVVVMGHSKPIWLGWRGGKSVATSLGVLLALNWPTGLVTFGVFLVVLALSRIVSLGSILAALSLPLWFWWFTGSLPFVGFSILASAFVIWRHQSNIQRLIAGTEPRLGGRSGNSAADLN